MGSYLVCVVIRHYVRKSICDTPLLLKDIKKEFKSKEKKQGSTDANQSIKTCKCRSSARDLRQNIGH